MSITFHFRPEEKVVVSVHIGITPDDEFLASYKSLYENTLFDISMNRLIDLRQVDTPERSIDSLRQLAEFVKGRELPAKDATNPKVAVLAPRNELFDLTLKYQVFTKDIPWDFIIFQSAGAALAWLDLPADLLDNLQKDT